MILSFSILKIRIFSLFEYDSEKLLKGKGGVRGVGKGGELSFNSYKDT